MLREKKMLKKKKIQLRSDIDNKMLSDLLGYVQNLFHNEEMRINVIHVNHSKDVLYIAEENDDYISSCMESNTNSLARANTTYKAASLSEQDYIAYNDLFKEYTKLVPERLLYDLDYVNVLILMPSADHGFPHTREKQTICFPQAAVLPPLKTFIHELWHIHQRKFMDLWQKLYQDVWKFKAYDSKHIPEEIYTMIRINPDTIQYGLYCWRDEWVPIPVFLSPTQPKMNECEIWFWNAKTHRIRRTMPEAWRSYFHSSLIPNSAYEHPNELSAYMLAELPADTRSPQAFVDLAKAVGAISLRTKV